MLKLHVVIIPIFLPVILMGQTPEKQISFASESKSHAYYVEQAELWWKEIEKNKTAEDSWYNYYRACRNAQGTANWREDFVNESPFLRSGPDIVKLMGKYIPDTFTYNYVSYSQRGIDPSKGSFLLKAYQMNPDFEGINSEMVTYAVSILDNYLRKKVNNAWYLRNELSPGLLAYAYNVLMSLESSSVLLTQHDNDSYPVWMLQDVKGIRSDVMVINFDFLLLDSYREKVFNTLKIKQLDLKLTDSYEVNWKNVLRHLLTNYSNARPLYIGMTVSRDLYKDFSDKISISGLAFRFRPETGNMVELNRQLIEHSFLLDYLKVQLMPDSNQKNTDRLNLNYLRSFKIVYSSYKSNKEVINADKIRELALIIAGRSADESVINQTNQDFK